jgi:hypothetical protein
MICAVVAADISVHSLVTDRARFIGNLITWVDEVSSRKSEVLGGLVGLARKQWLLEASTGVRIEVARL